MMRNDSRCVVGRAAVAGRVRAINPVPFAQPLQKSHLLQNRVLTADTIGSELEFDATPLGSVRPVRT